MNLAGKMTLRKVWENLKQVESARESHSRWEFKLPSSIFRQVIFFFVF